MRVGVSSSWLGPGGRYRPYFWNSHSPLSSGQTWRVFNHRLMQWKWNAWLHTPHATVHSSAPALLFAWHSIHKSMIWFRQMAQLSTTMSHAHSATAFHFLISKRFSAPGSGQGGQTAEDDAAPVSISTSAMIWTFVKRLLLLFHHKQINPLVLFKQLLSFTLLVRFDEPIVQASKRPTIQQMCKKKTAECCTYLLVMLLQISPLVMYLCVVYFCSLSHSLTLNKTN